MDSKIRIKELSPQELIEISAGGPLLNKFLLYAWYNREMIWDYTVGAYIEGFREGFAQATAE